MVWGGSLNEKGSEYIRKLREADKVIQFLEKLKENLVQKEKDLISETIEIIVNYFNKAQNVDV